MSRNGPRWYTACNGKAVCGVAGIDEWLSLLAQIGLKPVERSAADSEAIRQHTQ